MFGDVEGDDAPAVIGPSSRVIVGFVDGELVAQSQVIDGEPAVAAEEDGEEPKQVVLRRPAF